MLDVLLVAEGAAGLQALRLVDASGHRLVAVLSSSGETRGASVPRAAGDLGIPVEDPRQVTDLAFGDRVREVDLLLNVHSLHVARPVGALLLRRYLPGPQELSTTDGATDTVHDVWQRLGGRVNDLASVGWTRVLGPAAFASAIARRRGRRGLGGPASGVVDRVAGRPFAAPAPEASSSPLTPAAFVEGLDALAQAFPLRPAYDRAFLDWLFGELAAVRARGDLVARLVRGRDGKTLGWYVAYASGGEVAQALQVAAPPEHAGAVLDELFHHVAGLGAAGVQGRIEPHLHAALRRRRCFFRRTEWALLHGGDAETRDAIADGRALLTRLEGEWWMGHHLA